MNRYGTNNWDESQTKMKEIYIMEQEKKNNANIRINNDIKKELENISKLMNSFLEELQKNEKRK